MNLYRLKKTSPAFSILLSGFIKKGNRAAVELLFSSILSELKRTHGEQYIDYFEAAVLNLTPKLRLRSKRKAGIVYKIPFALTSSKTSFSFASRWFRQAVYNRTERGLEVRILRELQDAYNKRGEGFKRRETVHQTALLNRGFIRFLK